MEWEVWGSETHLAWMPREEGIFPVLARKGEHDQLVSCAAKCTMGTPCGGLNMLCMVGARFHQAVGFLVGCSLGRADLQGSAVEWAGGSGRPCVCLGEGSGNQWKC